MRKSVLQKSFVAFLIFFSMLSYGQQQAMYTQYMFNHGAVNPAYIASKNAISAILLARTQWVGLAGAPYSGTFSINGPIKREKIGIGLSILYDVIGPIKETNINADFAFQFKLTKDINISLGVKVGFEFYNADLSKLRLIDQNDPRFQDVQDNFIPNVGCGVFVYNNDFYAGLSVPKIIRNTINISPDASLNSNSKEERHFFLIGGYVFNLTNDLKLKPSFLAKMVSGNNPAIDYNASVIIKDRIWLGASYRYDNSISAMIELRVGAGLLLGYAFDFTTSKLMRFNDGTHEVLISYDLNFDRYRVKSPRYF